QLRRRRGADRGINQSSTMQHSLPSARRYVRFSPGGFFALTSTNRSNCIVMNGSHGLKDRRALLAGIGGLAAGALMTNRTEAGPLNPPAAPNPTMKTLDQIEPRTAINSVNTPGDADSVFRI